MSQSSSPNKENILDRLRQVTLADNGEDIVSAGLVSGVTVSGDRVGFLLEGDADSENLRKACENAVSALEGVSHVTAVLTAHQNEPSTQAPKPSAAREKAVWNREPIAGVKRVIAVASGKGGVGKSSIATLLALALAKQGESVGLLDADIYGPSIPTMLGVSGQAAFEDGKLVPEIAHNIACMSMGLIVGNQATVMRAPRVTKALNQMLRGTNWIQEGKPVGRPSHEHVKHRPMGEDEPNSEATLIIDLPPGTGDVHLSMVQNVPINGAIIVTLASKVAALDAKKSIEMFEKVDVPILGIVENMSHMPGGAAPFGSGGGEALAKETGYPLLAKLPLEPEIGELLNQGGNPFEASGKSELLAGVEKLVPITSCEE